MGKWISGEWELDTGNVAWIKFELGISTHILILRIESDGNELQFRPNVASLMYLEADEIKGANLTRHEYIAVSNLWHESFIGTNGIKVGTEMIWRVENLSGNTVTFSMSFFVSEDPTEIPWVRDPGKGTGREGRAGREGSGRGGGKSIGPAVVRGRAEGDAGKPPPAE